MKKKWILSIFSAVLAIGLLAGCSGEGEEVPESNEGMNEDIDVEAPSDVPVAPDNNTDSSSEPSEPSEPIEEPTDETVDDDEEDMLNEEPTDEDDTEKDSN